MEDIIFLQVYVNGNKCMKFDARLNVEDIKGIMVKGEAFIYQVKLERKLVSLTNF